MSSELLDNDPQNYILPKKLLATIIFVLSGLFWIWKGISEWYTYYHPPIFSSIFMIKEIAYPIKILSGILITSTSILVWLDKLSIPWSIFIFVLIAIIGTFSVLYFC